MRKLRGIALLAMLCSASTSGQAYVVQPGDTLSSVALNMLKSPKHVYGEGGRLELLVSYNTHLKNPDRIFPGDELFLSPQQDLRAPAAETPLIQSEIPDNFQTKEPPESAAAPTAAPVPESVASDTNAPAPSADERDLRATVSISQVYTRLDGVDRATNAKATFISDLLTEVDVGLHQRLAEQHDFGVHVSWRQNKFESPKTGQTVAAAPSTKTLRARYTYSVLPRLHVLAGGGFEQRLFIRSDSATHYVFDVPQIPFMQSGVNVLLVQSPRRLFGIRGMYTQLGPATTTGQEIQAGSRTEATLFMQQRRGNFELSEDLFWSSGTQDSSIVKQKQTAVGIGINLGYFF